MLLLPVPVPDRDDRSRQPLGFSQITFFSLGAIPMFRKRNSSQARRYRPTLQTLEARYLLSTYLVDHLADDGVGTGTSGSLRYCITQAMNGDAITFGVTGTINLNSALPDLAHSININGPGANLLTVRGRAGEGYVFRVFTVLAGATVNISGLTITNGLSYAAGGGIRNAGTLTLSNSMVTGNTTEMGCFDCVIPAGGGIFNVSTIGRAVLTIINSTVSGNSAHGDGGGIANGDNFNFAFPGGAVSVINSTVSDNYAFLDGGGIWNGYAGDDYDPRLDVINSTIVGNRARYIGGISNDEPVTITNSTIARNAASDMRGVGGIAEPANMRNTIVAGNSGYFPDIAGTLSSSGYNLIGNTFGGSGFDPTDLLNVDPLLGPLQNNGGPTQTMALLSGSPALNAGDPAQLGVPDQRGVVRKGGVNIGAYQASASAFLLTAPNTVTSGTPFDVTVKAVDVFGQVAFGYTGTVTFRTTDRDPNVVLPADYTFTAADQGTHTFSGAFTLITPGDQTLTVSDTADNTLIGNVTVTVAGGAAPVGLRPPRDSAAVDLFFAAVIERTPTIP
jgi:hypothetical protein